MVRLRAVAGLLSAFVRSLFVLRASRSLCKTGVVMRFGEHFRAADFYKSGNCRGICVKVVLDSLLGQVGFLVKSAQRADIC
jgi:hypothetical protein